MKTASQELFEYAVRYVTRQDIVDFVPRDPGTRGYIRECTAILETRTLPAEVNSTLDESINLTRWSDAESGSEPVRFRRFRTFTHAVWVAFEADKGWKYGDVRAHYTAITLFDDAYALGDTELLALLSPVFEEIHACLVSAEFFFEQAPFLVLAQMFLCFIGQRSKADLPGLAVQLLAEESRCRSRDTHDFLWGCSSDDLLHDRWRQYVARLFPRDHPDADVTLVRAALLAEQ